MITTHSIKKLGLLSIALLVFGFTYTAQAATLGASVGATTTTNGLNIKASAGLSAVIAKGDKAIDARITALNNLSARIQALKKVSDSEKTAVATEVQSQISALTTLKAKIDADTDVTVARADVKTITADYRIYALIIPQGYILASADRVSTIVSLMTALQVKLQTRITALQSAGKDVTALQAALTDMNAKMSDATTLGAQASAKVSALSPDQGNATVAASNKAALESARASIKSANQDLKAARKDISTIMAGVKIKASTSASAQTQ